MGLYVATGESGTHGQAVTVANSGAAQVLGSWTWDNTDKMSGTPTEWLGMRRTPDGSVSYTRWVDPAPESEVFCVSAPMYLPGTAPSTHFNFLRVTPSNESSLANVFWRTTRRFRGYIGASSLSDLESPVLPEGWFVPEFKVDRVNNRLGLTVWDETWTDVYQGYSNQTISAAPVMARVGEPQAGTYGFSPMRVGAGIRYGTLTDPDDWMGNTMPAPPEPPPDEWYLTENGAWVPHEAYITESGQWHSLGYPE